MTLIWMVLKIYLLCALALAAYAWVFERFFMRADHKFGRAGLLTLAMMICFSIFVPCRLISCIREYPKGKWQRF